MLCGYGGYFLLRYKVMTWWEISIALFSETYKMLCFSFKTQDGALVGNINSSLFKIIQDVVFFFQDTRWCPGGKYQDGKYQDGFPGGKYQ